jgi:hypothetical protein
MDAQCTLASELGIRDSFAVTSLGELLRATRESSSESWVVVDLSLDAWAPRQIAREIALQLGLDLPDVADGRGVASAAASSTSYAAILRLGIDAEARGESAALIAASDADLLAPVLIARGIHVFVLATPRSRADEYTRHFARRLLSRYPAVRVSAAVNAGVRDPGGTLGVWTALPGIISAEDADNLRISGDSGLAVEGFPLAGGAVLVPPEQRSFPEQHGRLAFDAVAQAVAGTDWLQSYAQLHGHSLFVDAALMVRQAWAYVVEGSLGRGLELLDRAIATSRAPAERAALRVQVLGMRIAGHRFADVACAPEPERTAEPSIRAFHYQAKGWGHVWSGTPVPALRFLAEARALRGTVSGTSEDLFERNITALAHLRAGDPDGALELELQIEREAARLDERDYRLEYVNCMNLARLYRRSGDLTTSRRYYERAFATTLGTRSPYERVYINVSRAMLEEASGETAKAHASWLRAAAHWLAMDVPEATGPRILQAILGRSLREGEDPVDLVSNAFAHRIEVAEADLEPTTQRAWAIVPRFVDIERAAPTSRHGAIVTPAGCFLLSHEASAAPATSRATTDRLALVVLSALHRGARLSDWAGVRTIIVDDQHGTELPISLAEAVSVARRHGLVRIESATGSIGVPAWTPEHLASASIVELGPAVNRIETAGGDVTVTFKRCRPPVRLSDAEAAVLARWSELSALGDVTAATLDGDGSAECQRALRSLEAARVLRVWVSTTLTESSTCKAGIKSPSNAISEAV